MPRCLHERTESMLNRKVDLELKRVIVSFLIWPARLLVLNTHVINDRSHTLDLSSHFNGFTFVGLDTDKAAQLDLALEGLDMNLSRLQ